MRVRNSTEKAGTELHSPRLIAWRRWGWNSSRKRTGILKGLLRGDHDWKSLGRSWRCSVKPCSAYLQKEDGKKNPMKDGTQKRSIYLKKKKRSEFNPIQELFIVTVILVLPQTLMFTCYLDLGLRLTRTGKHNNL